MKTIRALLHNERYIKISLFTVLTAVSLCAACLLLLNLKAILTAIFSFLAKIAGVFSPLWIGLILAYLTAPLVNKISEKIAAVLCEPDQRDPLLYPQREKQIRGLAVLLTFLMIAAALAVTLYSFFILIAGHVTFASPAEMTKMISDYFSNYRSMLHDFLNSLPDGSFKTQLQEALRSAAAHLQHNFHFRDFMRRIPGFGGSLINFVLGIIVCVYLQIDRTFFLGLWRKTLHLLLPMEYSAKFSEALRDVNTVVSLFLRGQLLDGLIVAILSSIGLSFIRLDFAVLIGCFAGICNIIPYFGPIMGMIPAALAGLLAGRPLQAAAALAVLFVIQQADSALISPRVVGKSVGLHPVFVLLAVAAGNACFGIIGMLLAVPAAAILQLFFVRKINSL